MNADTPARRHCRELFAQLSEYVDGELDASICDEIDRHMVGCSPCIAFVESLKRTVRLVESQPAEPLPADIRRELLDKAARLRNR